MAEIFYVAEPNTSLFKMAGQTAGRSGSVQVLMGARLHVDSANEHHGWARAETVPDGEGKMRAGFVEMSRLSKRRQLKVFYTDVGQGDAILIEAEDAVIVIDGGPNSGFHDHLNRRLESLRRADVAVGLPERASIHVNIVVVSHFDTDHYVGLTRILKDPAYTFGTIYHNGLPRYGNLAGKDLDLGTLYPLDDGSKSISTDLRDLDSARTLLESNALLTDKGNLNRFGEFLEAAISASSQGRLSDFQLLVKRDVNGPRFVLPGAGEDIELEVLAPVTTQTSGRIRLQTFSNPHSITERNPHPSPSDSHTINGNSIVLRLTYGQSTFLFGGDLNQPAQRYLSEKYGNLDRFSADVNKACHHGSPDFELSYLKAVNPHATIFSSGDNGSYDHPFPDAMGAAAKHSRGDFPLVFSTELAREIGSGGIKLGHINARSNKHVIVMAQKKEKPSVKEPWHTFMLPYIGL